MTLSYDLTTEHLHDIGADLRTERMFSQWLAARGRTSTRLTPDDLEDAANYGLNVGRIVWLLEMTTCFLDETGARRWYRDGLLHRDDGPAVECADGSRRWYRIDHLHRDDGPAVERADGTREWYRYGLLHRADGPAVEWPDGRVEYWTDGRRVA